MAPALHRFDPATGRDERWDLPAAVGALALAGRGVLLALRTGLHALAPESGALGFVAPPPCDPRRFVLNDGGCDPAGRFLVGAMHDPLPGPHAPGGPDAAPLWRFDPPCGWAPLTAPVRTSNGLAWSPDGRTLYHADTAARTIRAHDYDPATGAVARGRVFARVEEGGPDGAAVDRDGFYWSALYGGGCLLRFDPAGRLERRVPLPVRYPTMPAFGGDGLGTLFVTSACKDLSAAERRRRPEEGRLLSLPAPVPGLPAHRLGRDLPPAG